MIVCPNCGDEQEYNRINCQNCRYTFRYNDVADYDKESIRFTILFECKNCGRTFKLGFGRVDKVHVEGIARQNTKVNHHTGNPIRLLVGGRNCRPQCPTCESDTSLYISQKRPVRDR